jgi:adenosylcobinamide kinase/adenosylcobinamide-phosphate guanylyltransferase
MIDCVSGMLNNLMYNSKIDFETCLDEVYENFANDVKTYVRRILSSMQKKNIKFVIVTNELGLSTVSISKYVRRYVSLHGEINQMFCGISDEVYFLLSGIATKIK